jgi:hypothetical protein
MDDLHDALPVTAPEPDVVVASLAAPPEVHGSPPMVRRRSVVAGLAIALAVAFVSAGGVWWHAAVTGDPGLEFYGGPNVFRYEASTDYSGIDRKTNVLGTEVAVAFVPTAASTCPSGCTTAVPTMSGSPPATPPNCKPERRPSAASTCATGSSV